MKISEWLERKKKYDDELDEEKQKIQTELKKSIPESLQKWEDKDLVIENIFEKGSEYIVYND